MKDRRASARSKVLLGGIAEINASHPTMDCVVRNLSEDGACVEVDSDATLPAHMKLVIAQKGRSYLARLMWRQANRVGLAFMAMIGCGGKRSRCALAPEREKETAAATTD